MKTTFLRWLEKRGETASSFHTLTGLSVSSIYTLAGIGYAKTVRRLDPGLCKQVEALTGIPWEKLLKEAEAARESPVLPRKYERRVQNAAE